MICKNCGKKMREDNKILTSYPPKKSYTCEHCGYVEYVIIGGKIEIEDNEREPHLLKGWVCPKCGGVMSPFQNTCPYCAPPVKLEVWN